MSDFNLVTMFAITIEMFGFWFWIGLVAAGLVLALHVAGWRSARPLTGRNVRLSVLMGLACAIAVALLLPAWTHSSLVYLSGAADIAALAAFAGAIGLAIALLASAVGRWLSQSIMRSD